MLKVYLLYEDMNTVKQILSYLLPRYNGIIVESGVKHRNHLPKKQNYEIQQNVPCVFKPIFITITVLTL